MNSKIAVVAGVYNEERRIGYFLESVKVFDDVIVFDKGSDDNTVDICQSYGAKVYNVKMTDIKTDPEYSKIFEKALDETDCDWIIMLVCSDIVHPQFYEKVKRYIRSNDVDVVEVPFYRYSMGFTSKYSFYRELHYKDILLKKCKYINDSNIHVMAKYDECCKVGRMIDEDYQVAIYHLTHENLEIILERHLRYAKEESTYFVSREEGLQKTWRELLRQVYYYFKLRTYKLGEKGKAQLCMLLLYRAAKYLNVYFDDEKEAEITAVYDEIRKNQRDKNIKKK